MVKRILYFFLFFNFISNYAHSSNLNITEFLNQPVYFNNHGAILLNEQYKNQNDKKDLYIFSPLQDNAGYYLGYSTFKKFLLTVGSKGHVYLFNKNGNAQQKCSFVAKSKSSSKWNEGKITVICPGKNYYKGNFTQSYDGNTGQGTVKYCFDGSQKCNGRSISFIFNSNRYKVLLERDKYISSIIRDDISLADLFETNCNQSNLSKRLLKKCDYLSNNNLITKKTVENVNLSKDIYVFCQNKYDGNLISKRSQRCDSSEQEVSENLYYLIKGLKDTNQAVKVTPEKTTITTDNASTLLIDINKAGTEDNKNRKFNDFVKNLEIVSSNQFTEEYAGKIFFEKTIWQLTEYNKESFDQHAYATYFSKEGDYLELFIKKNKNNRTEYGAFKGKWIIINKDTIRVNVEKGFFKYEAKNVIDKELHPWSFDLKIYELNQYPMFFSTGYESKFAYDGATIVGAYFDYEQVTHQLDSVNTLLDFAKRYSKSPDSEFNLFDIVASFKKEADEKRKVAEARKKEQTVVVTNDTIGPEIIVNKTFKANQDMIANIKGRVEDDSKVVSLTIDGDQVAFTQGSFNQPLYVLPNGQEIEIVAIDKFGNQSKKIVTLQRDVLQTQTVSIDKLNPLAIKAPLNNNAVALIIGVEDYENTFKAAYAKKDALFFNDFAHQAFGVPRYNIKLLINSGARRNDTLLQIATWLPKIIKEKKTDFYLFFSGHGLASANGEDLFLLPYDGYPAILDDSALLRNRIFESIASLNPRSVTVFLDTCYSGATRSEEMLVAARPIMIEVEEQEIPNNFTVFSASANNEIASVFKEAEHGLFSYFLMKGLEGEADSNNDQQITNGELIAYINHKVSRQASQTPQLAGDASRILVQW